MAAANSREMMNKIVERGFRLRRRAGMSAAALTALILVGCGPSKVAQCNQLAEVVNQTQGFMQEFETEIQTFSENASQVKNLDDIKSAASQYTTAVDKVVTNLDGLVGDLQSTSLQDETLVQFRDSYVGVVQGFSSSLQEARQAMDLVVTVDSEADLPARIEESQQQTMTAVSSIEELSQTEAQLISEVNAYCGAAQPVETETEESAE
jgi:ABC-type transporter Mla subunit MlaD